MAGVGSSPSDCFFDGSRGPEALDCNRCAKWILEVSRTSSMHLFQRKCQLQQLCSSGLGYCKGAVKSKLATSWLKEMDLNTHKS